MLIMKQGLVTIAILLVARRWLYLQTATEKKYWFITGVLFKFVTGAIYAAVKSLIRGTTLHEGWSTSKEAAHAGLRNVSNHLQDLVELDPDNYHLMRKVFEYVGARTAPRMEEDGYTTFDYDAGHVCCRAVLPKELVGRVKHTLGLETSELLEREKDTKPIKWVMHFHGGGYVSGTKLASQSAGWHFGRTSQDRRDQFHLVAIMVDYSLAPEAVFPAAVIDAASAYHWHVSVKGLDPKDILLSGESAGGGLAASTLVALRDGFHAHLSATALAPFHHCLNQDLLNGIPELLPAAAVICSPMLDCTDEANYCKDRAELDLITARVSRGSARTYVPNRQDAKNPLASPILADLHGLPPLFVTAGGVEIFHPLCEDFARRAQAHDPSNVVYFKSFHGMAHSFQLQWEAGCHISKALYAEMIDFFVQHSSAKVPLFTRTLSCATDLSSASASSIESNNF